MIQQRRQKAEIPHFAAMGSELDIDPKWYLAVTNPNCERRAVLELYQAGFRTFVPKLRKWISHARVRTAVERPLLGRYVFVEIDHPRQSFHKVRSANGVECLISNPDPLVVPDHWVENLRFRYMAGEWDFVRTDRERPIFAWDAKNQCDFIASTEANEPTPVGARVRVVEGEFEDMLATITSRKGHKVTAKLLDSTQYIKLQDCSVRAA